MLDYYLLLILESIAETYNTRGMPEMLRYQLQIQAEQLIDRNRANFSLECDSCTMRVVHDSEMPGDDYIEVDTDTLDTYLDDIELLDLID